MEAVAATRQLNKTYRQGLVDVHALRDVDLTIERGEFLAIAGPSGSGKTTLLNLLGALMKPTSGTVEIDGVDIGTMSRTKLSELRLQRIGFIFQAYNLIPVLTAYENAEFVLLLQKTDEESRRHRVMDILSAVGLEGMENRFPRELSGGQQQRVAIARAIAAQPALILADEPTANLDSESAENLLDIMQNINQEQGATFVFSTHDPRVMKRARRLVRLVDGAIDSDETRA